MANAISTHRPSQEDYDMLDALERALSEIDSALEDRDLEEVLLAIETEIGYTTRSKVESIKSLAKRYNARILISDRELEDIIEAEKGRGWLFRVANRVAVEHNGQRKRLLDVIREQAIKMKKAKKSKKVAEEVDDMLDIEARVKTPEEKIERYKTIASERGARLITSEDEIKRIIKEALEKYKDKRKAEGYIRKNIMIEYQGQKMTLAELIAMNRKKPELSKEALEERKRSVYIKPHRGAKWYKYTLESKLKGGRIEELDKKDREILGRIFYEVIRELYPYASSSATITRMLASGAGAKLAITNYPKLYSSRRAFSDILKALVKSGYFDDKSDGWKALAVIFRVRVKKGDEENKVNFVKRLNEKLEKTAQKLNDKFEKEEIKIRVEAPKIDANYSISKIYEEVIKFYQKVREALIEAGKLQKPERGKLTETAKQELERYRRKRLKEYLDKRKSLLGQPPGEPKGRSIRIEDVKRRVRKVAEGIEEIEELGDIEDFIEEEIAEYEREVGAEFLEVSQPVSFTQSLVNGLVIGFVSIGTLWATSKISDFIANWISKWLKADERYIKAFGDIGAGILILNSPNIWRAFMKDEMPIQGKVAALVVGWGSIANGITLAIRNERLIKVSEMVDSAIEGIGRFITNAITQKPEENETSKLQNITQTTDDWRISTNEDIETGTEEIYGLDLLPTKADTTEADTEYVEYNFEVEN